MEKVRVIIYGVGRVGGTAVRIMASRKWIEISGAIDNDKSKVGRDLGEVAGLGRKLAVTVSDDPQAVFQKAGARVVLHTTSLHDPEEAEAQILQCLEAGLHVISTTDWRLTYPWFRHPEWGKRVDELARRRGVTFLESGLIPGFESDLIPILYSGACGSVKKISVRRSAIAFGRSPTQLAYLGFGLSMEEFQKKLADGSIRTSIVALRPPQIDMVADALGWKLDEVTRAVEPIPTTEKITLPNGYEIGPGKVIGFRTVHTAIRDKKAVITITLEHQLGIAGEDEKYKVETRIEGEPNLHITARGYKSGICTAARAVNYIPQVLAARPGLVTIRELPVAAALE